VALDIKGRLPAPELEAKRPARAPAGPGERILAPEEKKSSKLGWLGRLPSLFSRREPATLERKEPRRFEHGLSSMDDFLALDAPARADRLARIVRAMDARDIDEVPGVTSVRTDLDRRFLSSKDDPVSATIERLWDDAEKDAGPYASLRIARRQRLELQGAPLATHAELLFLDQAGRRIGRDVFILPDGTALPEVKLPRSTGNEAAQLEALSGKPKIAKAADSSWEKQTLARMQTMGDFFQRDIARMDFERAMEEKFSAQEPFNPDELKGIHWLLDKRNKDMLEARAEGSGLEFHYAADVARLQEWSGTADKSARTRLLTDAAVRTIDVDYKKALATASQSFDDESPAGREKALKELRKASDEVQSIADRVVSARFAYGLQLPAATLRTAAAARDLLPRIAKVGNYFQAQASRSAAVPFSESTGDLAKYNPVEFFRKQAEGTLSGVTPELVALARQTELQHKLSRSLETVHTIAYLMNPYLAAEGRQALAEADALIGQAKAQGIEPRPYVAKKQVHLEQHRQRIDQLSKEHDALAAQGG
jgi:hypothetical protein